MVFCDSNRRTHFFVQLESCFLVKVDIFYRVLAKLRWLKAVPFHFVLHLKFPHVWWHAPNLILVISKEPLNDFFVVRVCGYTSSCRSIAVIVPSLHRHASRCLPETAFDLLQSLHYLEGNSHLSTGCITHPKHPTTGFFLVALVWKKIGISYHSGQGIL